MTKQEELNCLRQAVIDLERQLEKIEGYERELAEVKKHALTVQRTLVVRMRELGWRQVRAYDDED